MTISDKARLKISRLMHGHQEWLNKWDKRSGFLSVEMISPRGKRMTVSAYQFEVNKRMNQTIDKIAKVVQEDSGIASAPEGGKAAKIKAD